MSQNTSASGASKSEALLNSPILPTMLRFAVPIILGNIFQQLYNIVDAIVVGKYLGDLPLSGISIASPVMDILYALLLGGSIGIGVLIGTICGAEDWEKLKRVHATALTGGVCLTLCVSAAALLFTRSLLTAQGSAPEVIDQAMRYLTIILIGLVFCYLYNYFAAALRSYGNSRTPFVVLLVSSTLHALIDVLLCGVLHMGISGVACSTVFCQVFSTVWLVLYTQRHCPPMRLSIKELRFDPKLAGLILSFAWAAALQQAVVMIGRFLVQGMLTPLGPHSVTGYNMAVRSEQFLFCFSQGISASMVVGISQNRGHGNKDRVRGFYSAGIKSESVFFLLLAIPFYFFAEQVMRLFSDNSEIIGAGVVYIRTMAMFYLMSFLGEVIQGFFRGIGRLRITMTASMCQIALRVFLSYFLIPAKGIPGICTAICTGWVLLVIIEGSYSLHVAKNDLF